MEKKHSEQLLSVVYLSSASRLYTDEEVLEMLRSARQKNERLGITGMLLYKKGNFMQVLEGPVRSVQELLATISNDARHNNVLMLRKRPATSRDFGNWSMALVDTSKAPPELEGILVDFLSRPLKKMASAMEANAVYKLLLRFRQAVE